MATPKIRNKSHIGKLCECSSPAAIFRHGQPICARCARLEAETYRYSHAKVGKGKIHMHVYNFPDRFTRHRSLNDLEVNR